ncbi:MAG: DEAD/DEAH box helicase [Candidatus Hydrogenedentota bacterium]|nr:MAG: DEAD/DEAH box helicase [Candidatus Hydrogenedentota bacterium]
MNLTPHQTRYYAFDITRRGRKDLDRLSQTLFEASVDLNPHQIEAALFALRSPLSKGAILCDEVGLGKTIEAGIVLCQFWAERKRRLLVLCPASLRKQWALELEEKFHLPTLILDARSMREAQRNAKDPFREPAILIMSYQYAHRVRDRIRSVGWDLVVIDEAHKLRNAYRPSNVLGQSVRWATEDCRKLLLTATPLQNSLLELYGLSTIIDDRIFGDIKAFRSQFMGTGADLGELRRRLAPIAKRTLRNQVTEYIRYTERRAITQPFHPSDDEEAFYRAVADFLEREDSYAIPTRQKHLTKLILYKLLASSTPAIVATLEMIRARLDRLAKERDREATERDFVEKIVLDEELEPDLLDEILEEDGMDQSADEREPPPSQETLDRRRLEAEIAELDRLIAWAGRLGKDTKTTALLTALSAGFEQMRTLGAAEKALIFTESRKTQDYLKQFLESNGYQGKVVVFNGSNSGPEATAIYEAWKTKAEAEGRSTGTRAIDVRTALIEHFRDEASIMIATEAGAEGVNLQFCSLVINYDLPWNPQRVEQRIGRCHRYGQKYDVVVINFLNERNHADRRILELLSEKFRLFSGIFGASDEILGAIESGLDFERRILEIYSKCRTGEEIDAAFAALQKELEESIRARMDKTRRELLEHFDEDVHERLRLRLEDAKTRLDRFGKRFWLVTRFVLEDRADFNEESLSFTLRDPPIQGVAPGNYHLIHEGPADRKKSDRFLYRLSHPLGEWVVETAKALDTPCMEIAFEITNHPTKVSVVEALKGRSGWLTLERLLIRSYEDEEYLLFTGITENGETIDQETLEKMLGVSGCVSGAVEIPPEVLERLQAEAARRRAATISRSLEENNRHFQEARERLEKWADDMVLAAEKALRDTKEEIKVLRREARRAESLEEQKNIQEKMRILERKMRRQRKEIFRVEDKIAEKRDELIEELEKRLSSGTEHEEIFTIRWRVV